MAKKLISRELVSFAGKENTYGLSIIREIWEFEDGLKKVYWKYNLPNAVQIIGITTDGDIIAIEEFQPGLGINYLHLPGETIEGEETPFQAANRGLLEETGYQAGSLRLLSSILENTGRSDRIIYFILAVDCVKVNEGEYGINIMHFRPEVFWANLMEYFLTDPDSKHGGGNSLKAAVLAFHYLGLVKI